MEQDKFPVKGVPAKAVTMKEVAFAAYHEHRAEQPASRRPTTIPPNMTSANSAYVAVVDVDRDQRREGTPVPGGDDCGTVINPIIVEGRPRRLTEASRWRFISEIHADAEEEQPEHQLHQLYLVPTSQRRRTGGRQRRHAGPRRPMGAKGVGQAERRQPGGVRQCRRRHAVALGVRRIDMPMSWTKLSARDPAAEGAEGVA